MEANLLLNSGNHFLYEETRIQRINWSEEVSFEEYKKILLAAAESARQGYINVIIDRTILGPLPAECRVWMKNEYLKTHVEDVIPKLRKVAIIQSQSMLGQIYFSTIGKAVPLKYPNLAFKSFETEAKAKEWIHEGEEMVTADGSYENPASNKKQVSKNSIIDAVLRLFK